MIIISGVLLELAACNLEREVDITLPEYESRYVVECYLEPGQPISLLLSRSAAYFEPFPQLNEDFLGKILVDSAKVAIIYNGVEIPLENRLIINPLTQKVYNYYSSAHIPYDTINPFELSIATKDGLSIHAATRLLPVVPIDSLVVQFAEGDTLARLLTYITDNTTRPDYYRRMLHEGSLDSIPVQDFATDDRLAEGTIVYGTRFNYEEGDTLIATIFHIDKAYHDFLESLVDATGANGNPFAQPSPIISNLEGTANAIGIFTGLTYDRKTVAVSR
ncbi:MAG: DUF4249 domain-containing protein [Phaeodactylibacter sp.]|nr:DUF4249 domain-containing protein [Phaeodactylibacter sp.]MCB9272870.1 DUF4249 domain-containing protein [Lewinellaceae bacterium]